jgi:L-threonylcarbamoyladenylate synthase
MKSEDAQPPATQLTPATDEAISRAVAALARGALIAFPTETVYGLGADAENADAMRALFAAKGRPADHPVIVHLADAVQIEDWAIDIPEAAWLLAAAFWPGPMTLILRRGYRASDLATGGQGTVGLRVPAHPVAHALLREFGGGIAAPSANRFGRVSPTRAEHVLQERFENLEMILDGGPCQIGLESTIIDLTRGQPAILRPGAVTAEQIAAMLGSEIAPAASAAPRVSGSLASHYAPRARVELLSSESIASRAAELQAAGVRVAVLAPDSNDLPAGIWKFPLAENAEQRGRQLYAALRQADEAGCDVILTSTPAADGLGAAISDRLHKAAAPRDV